MHLESVSLLVHCLSLFCHHSLIDSFWKMMALTELKLTFDFVQRCSTIIRISVIWMFILDVVIVSKACQQYITRLVHTSTKQQFVYILFLTLCPLPTWMLSTKDFPTFSGRWRKQNKWVHTFKFENKEILF